MKRVNIPCIAADLWSAVVAPSIMVILEEIALIADIDSVDENQDYVVLMNIVSTVKDGDEELANKIVVQCMATDPTINPKDRIVKRAEREGLYPALQIASIWLDRNN